MPFFYSQYLKDDKKQAKSTTVGKPSLFSRRTAPQQPQASRRPPTAPRLVWHSNFGSSGPRKPSQPFKYGHQRQKTVHFSTVEVSHFHFDWSCAPHYFYSRAELTNLGTARFNDAALSRKERKLDVPSSNVQASWDDLDMAVVKKPKTIEALLATAFDDADDSESTSIRGIEHFVWPELQQEMIRRKKEVQAQVLQFVRAKRADPQGWRLAKHSSSLSQWARDVALQKARAYRMKEEGSNDEGPICEAYVENTPSNGSIFSTRKLESSASFSTANYCEDHIKDLTATTSRVTPAAKKEIDDALHEQGNTNVEETVVKQIQELLITKNDDSLERLEITMSNESDVYCTNQTAGANTDEA